MMLSVAIRTIPARAELFHSLVSRIIPALGSGDVRGLSVSADAELAPNENACRAIDGAARLDCDWVLFLEDDAGLIDDFFGSVARWIGDWQRPDVHIYPLGCQYDLPRDRAYWEYPIKAYYCSVALMVRASLATSLTHYLRMNSHVRQGFDIMSGHWHRTVSNSPFLVTPSPCLVEHLGDDSTLVEGRPGHNIVGRFRCFPGFDYSYRGVSRG